MLKGVVGIYIDSRTLTGASQAETACSLLIFVGNG